MNALVHVANKLVRSDLELLTCRVGDQWIGLHVQQVREVVTGHRRTVMPLSPSAVMGLINLRGRVLTELDVRQVLGLPEREAGASFHVAIIEGSSGEDFGLAVDDVGEVMLMDRDDYEPTPSSLDPVWRQVSEGVLKQDDRVLVLMNVDRFIALTIPGLETQVPDSAVVH
ncbi:MAG: purine-binding chemotaxis protein CheW [Zetaproteobacteria bacterium]|nr:purine-binding chemotaxis protein CheW [Zetaproteobacteria bacterium]